MRGVAALLAILAAAPASVVASISPKPGSGDPHIQSVEYDPQQVIQLRAAPGYALTVEFAADERIQSIAVGAAGAWQVALNKDADHLFIKASPQADATNMTVVTDARIYSFELAPLSSPDPAMAYVVRVSLPRPPPATTAEASEVESAAIVTYRFSGAKALRPASMNDDGKFTYITWGPKAAVAAIYLINAQGQESLVNGGVRDGRFVVDQIADEFVFRLGAQEARAHRRLVKARRK